VRFDIRVTLTIIRKERQNMVVVRVLFPTAGMNPAEFNEKMVASIPRYEGLDGLVRKYYVLTEDEQKGGGIYLWESREKAEQFYNQEWKTRIKELFGEAPMLEYLDCSIVIDNETKAVRNLVTA
tara:strand:+ start:671 stop:1042 length:372 start_codon:yes stop_codon:yes gene_type:complete